MNNKLIVLSTIFLTTLILGGCKANIPIVSNTTSTQASNPEKVEQTSASSAAVATTTKTTIPEAAVTQIELILDDSGSMAGTVGGKAKIDIAKESINKIIDELKLKDKLQVSLRIYGHQNKECTNSVLEIPMSKIDAEKMKLKIKDLTPLGSTPIYYSLTQSVNDFDKNIPGDKVIILVTDGLESCGGDPCAAAKALQASGVINKMQIVGFGMNKTELNTLQCIVDPFKGSVVGANNATEFLTAMQQIMEKATNTPNLAVSMVGVDEKPLQASDICVYPQGETNTEVTCAGMYTADFGFTLKPGVYDLKVVNGGTNAVTWIKNIEIKDGILVKKVISFAEGKLKVTIINANGEPTQASDICLYEAGVTDTPHACAGMFTTDYEFTAAPGLYDLKVIDYNGTNEKWLKNIDIKSSQTVTQKISL